MNRRSKSRWLSLALLVVVLQATALFVVIPAASSRLDWLYGVNGYTDGYNQIAENLVEGNGYRFYPNTARTLMREPGYPMLLAGVFIVFGNNFVVVKLVNMLLAFAAALLMIPIARNLTNNRLLILGAPVLFLLHPGTLTAESRGSAEIFFAFMLTLFLLTAYRAVKSNRWLDYAISGGALGLTVLVRSTPIAFPLFLLAYLLAFESTRIRKAVMVRNVAVMILAMFAVVSPWIVRNYSLTGDFVPTASVLGVAAQTGLYLSTHQQIPGQMVEGRGAAAERNRLAREQGYQFQKGYYQYFYSSKDEVDFSRYLFRRVVSHYERSPLSFVKVAGANLFNFWCFGKTWKSIALSALVQIPFLALAIVGVALCLRNDQLREIAPLALLITYVIAVSLPILAQVRYSVPLLPFLSILASVALASAWSRLRTEGKEMDERVDAAVAAFPRRG